jgi:two-component system, OmpR family, sensor histidine kinase TctE
MRKTLLLWLLVPLIILCASSTYLAYRFAEHSANDSYDSFLENSADSIVGRIKRDERGIIVADLPYAAQAVLRHHGVDKFYYQIVDQHGHRLTGDAVLPLPQDTSRPAASFRNATVEGRDVRMCRIAVQLDPGSEPIWVQVAETVNARQRLLGQILLSIMLPQIALVALSCGAVLLGVKHGLKALDKLSSLLRSRTKLDLSPVDIGETPAELEPVTSALNDLFSDANKHMHSQQEFIGNAAHQLRTPMTALKTYVDYLQRINDNTAVANVLSQLGQVTNRLVHMTNRLLVLARAEGNPKRRSYQTVDLAAVIDEAASSVVPEAINKGVEMHFDVPTTDIAIKGDAYELTELVTNLLENAVRYNTTPQGCVWVTVAKEDQLTITIADNGPGVPDAEKNRIFERFYRAAGSDKSGCGLGLAIVREIANKYNAKIELKDSESGGAAFSVMFPPAVRTETTKTA